MVEHTTHLKKRLLLCLILAVLALLLSRTAGAQAASVQPNCGSWSVVPSPNVSKRYNELDAVAAISANDVWAVGIAQNSPTTFETLTEHWNGSSWSIVPSPTIGDFGQLSGVAAVSSNDVWAVGGSLTEHWDGTQWSIVPNPAPTGGVLQGVTALASNNVWAVGFNTSPSGVVIEHWDGTQWSIVNAPNPGGSALYGIAATSANDIWAVGTLTEHWDGTQWSIIPNPGPHGLLFGVTALASNDVWAVGTSSHTRRTSKTLIEHWDGTQWSIVSSLNPGKTNGLGGVVALASNNVWAVGDYKLQSVRDYQTLIEHWDGSSWSIVASPMPGRASTLGSMTQVPGTGQLWAVGSDKQHGGDKTLTETYC